MHTDSTPFNVTYGTGSVSGSLATDTIHIGTLSSSLTFGLATNVSAEFQSYAMDGILGLGRGTTQSDSQPSVMDVLSTSNLISSKLYGIHLSRSKDGKLDGELNLGAVNKDRFTGDLNWSDVVDNDAGFWEIPLSSATVDGNLVSLTTDGARTAIIDTGTSYILLPPADALALHSGIPQFEQSSDKQTFSVPCDTGSTIAFSFGKEVYNISSADWIGAKLDSGLCRSNIIGLQTFGATQWLVGDVFLKNVYSAFDFDNKKVGFGVLSDDDAEEADATASSSSGSSSAKVSQTGTASSGSADPTSSADAASGAQQPEGQKGAGGAAGKATASLLGFAVMIALLSSFVFTF
ncbi:hypothetical protein N0V83_008673 [Neocucurbitaria cava]|uniref:Peptidase A1 domain-containing protein n=1 Tax=Neocucurbitaria cava TaxID=798079 RepID=A0A9W9CIZ5_9PLEO|nr:hypothetical protein N0V83_008673 [Neocucurbitaria cava]